MCIVCIPLARVMVCVPHFYTLFLHNTIHNTQTTHKSQHNGMIFTTQYTDKTHITIQWHDILFHLIVLLPHPYRFLLHNNTQHSRHNTLYTSTIHNTITCCKYSIAQHDGNIPQIHKHVYNTECQFVGKRVYLHPFASELMRSMKNFQTFLLKPNTNQYASFRSNIFCYAVQIYSGIMQMVECLTRSFIHTEFSNCSFIYSASCQPGKMEFLWHPSVRVGLTLVSSYHDIGPSEK